ncbi:MAG: hypothetical protein LC808_24515, partial [Actinobacteria bacterium]|nr:hypothetical protein [Actinomycetota bacterium]
ATVSDVVPVKATATDNHRINRIEFYNGPTLLGNALHLVDNWEFNLDTKTLPNGTLQLQAKAYDVSGNTELSPPIAMLVKN